MIICSTLILERDDLKEESKNKPITDLRPNDFKELKVRNLIKSCKIVMFHNIIFKNEYTFKGKIVQ